jgi:hypothetical protein
MMEIYAASKKLAPTELEVPEKSDTANKRQPSEEVQVKAINLGTGDNSKTTIIGVGLDSSASSRLTKTSSLGNQRT